MFNSQHPGPNLRDEQDSGSSPRPAEEFMAGYGAVLQGLWCWQAGASQGLPCRAMMRMGNGQVIAAYHQDRPCEAGRPGRLPDPEAEAHREHRSLCKRQEKPTTVCLFGDAGTGKSSSIKGILNRYYDEGLRIIEVYKHQFQDLNDVIAQIKNRNYKFIIYMDDLSFEEFEIEYKYLKAVIEGGLEKKPDNILIYATSNRRHLVREKSSDKLEIMDDDDLHSSDTVQEKLSLVYRFGVRIYYGAPSKKEFQTIVKRTGTEKQDAPCLRRSSCWRPINGNFPTAA